MLPARGELTGADLIYMNRAVFLRMAIAYESMPGKNDAVLIVCEDVFHVFLPAGYCSLPVE